MYRYLIMAVPLIALMAAAPAPVRADVGEACAMAWGDASVAACRNVPNVRTNDVGVLRPLAAAFIDDGDFDGAIEVYYAVQRVRPDDPVALYDLAGTLAFVRRYEEAAPLFERLDSMRPGDVEVQRSLAVVYGKLSRPAEARAALKRAAALGDVTAMVDLARLADEGADADAEAAADWLERAAEAGHLGAMRRLVDIYRKGLLGQAPDPSRAAHWAERYAAIRASE